MDDIDRAQMRDQQFRDDALARHVRAGDLGSGSDRCEDCDTPIDSARRRALPHAQRCIDCQRDHELRGRR